jgi:hypothetical protein
VHITPELNSSENRRLCIYNMFPRRYDSILQMIAHLPKIKEYGFNFVWLNPIHPATKETYHGDARTQSFYAMVDYDHYSEFLPDASDDKIIEFTTAAKKLGLTPMFDLVLGHIGKGASIIGRHPEFFKLNDSSNYSDVVGFDYGTNDLFDQIFETFWRPFINKYIKLGFTGVRVDQAKPNKLPPYAQKKIYDYIKNSSSISCVIFAEVLFDRLKVSDVSNKLRSTGITHITNSLYWAPCDSNWNKGDAQLHEIGQKTLACGGNGGTIGFAGFHDGLTVACKVHENFAYSALGLSNITAKAKRELKAQLKLGGAGENDINNLVNDNYLYQNISRQCEKIFASFDDTAKENHCRLIKQKLAMVALVSDGGWYLMSGDEYGCTSHCSVFQENYFGGTDLDKRWGGEYDFTMFIQFLNKIILSKLPVVQPGEWCELFFLEKLRDVFIIFKHFKNFPTQAFLLNIGVRENIFISSDLYQEIKTLSIHSKDLQIVHYGIEAQDQKNMMFDLPGI